MSSGIVIRSTRSTQAGWMAGLCIAVAIPVAVPADDCPSSPNNYGLTRGKIPYNNHWGKPLTTLFSGPRPNGDWDPHTLCDYAFKGDWHHHTWCDYTFAGDCYNENWRTNTWFYNTKGVSFHERTRKTSLALEQAFCGKAKSKWCQNGYLLDASGTPLLDFFHCQAPCAKPPTCRPFFAGHAALYEPYRFSMPIVSSPVISPAPSQTPVVPAPPAPESTDKKDSPTLNSP